MVVFVDLDEDVEPPVLANLKLRPPELWSRAGADLGLTGIQPSNDVVIHLLERFNPNRNVLTEAMGCYPIITEIASLIDLNTLDNLSRTCRQVRENLLQFRKLLIQKTLRCCNEEVLPNSDHTLRYRARAADWYFVEEGGANITGKVGDCARDMVSECRRCNKVICRNCTIKPPAPILLQHRHRRMCQTCIRSPLPSLISLHLDSSDVLSAENIRRSTCACPTDGVWLCQPCGRGLRSADTTYQSIWRWRTRYGPTLGGLGTGFGEGDRSFECGRQSECLAARQVEEEIDCDAEDAREFEAVRESDAAAAATNRTENQDGMLMGSRPSSAAGIHMGPGYTRHEIEGIGGVVKKKLVRMVKVGACVTQWEDETEQGKYLIREVEGRTRSWCGWCWRVIPGAKDKLV